MADTLLNQVINEEIKVDLFIKWLLNSSSQEQYFDEFNDCKCSQTEFLTYFLNFVHEEIPCQNRCGDKDTPVKVNVARRNEHIHCEETPVKKTLSLFTNIDKADINKPAASSSFSLNRTFAKSDTSLDDVNINVSRNTNSPSVFKIDVEHNVNNGYMSPISPLYRNQNSFMTPKNKRLSFSQESAEKISPLCLGDFIITRKSLDKKKANRETLRYEPIDESSKRIKPTSLCTVTVNGDFRKTENSFNNFQNTKEVSSESLNGNRNFLSEERLKILSRKNSGDDLTAITRPITNLVNFKVEVEPEVKSVSNKLQLDYVADVYNCILRNNLVLNITSEIYFLISLLLNKQFCKEGRDNVGSSLEEDFYLYADILYEEDKSELQSLMSGAKRKVCSSDLFETIHNVVYFATRCLESQIDVLRYYDKTTLKLLSQNKRLRLFAGAFAEKLRKISDKKTETVKEFYNGDHQQTNIYFNLDTDNRENFPNDSSCHAFRKQRDLFYEILRIWENSHMLSGWNFAVSLGGKIRCLVGLHNEPANFMHFSRLFKAQLLSTCGKSQKEEGLTEGQMPFLSSLPNVNADKLNRLKSRLVTKQSSNGINSLPSFTGPQEFYKDFIIVAASCAFNRHLCDTLMTEIVELNDIKFSYTSWEESEGNVDSTTRKTYLACLKSLRVLAKFLGFVESLPYKSDCVNYSEKMLTAHLNVRRQATPTFNVKQLLADSLKQNHAVLTVPWVTEYLSMLDYVTLRLPYYVSVYRILFDLYKNCDTIIKAGKSDCSYNTSLVRFCLGWLFELPHFPDSGYFNFCSASGDVKQIGRQKGQKTKCKDIKTRNLDGLDVVDQNILYVCCPYLEEIKKLLSSNALKSNVTVKHITPVTATQSSSEINKKRIEQQLEESFFNGQPISVKKTVEFVSERVASSCVKYICNTIVPTFKKTALDQLKAYLSTWRDKNDSMSPKKQKFHKVTLRTNVNQISQSNLANLRDACEKQVQDITKEKIPISVDSLLAIDVLPQVKAVCVGLATKMCVERVKQWMGSHVTLSIFTKDFDSEVQKVVNVENKKVVKEKAVFALPAGGSTKSHNDNTTSGFHLLRQIKELTIEVLEQNVNVTEEVVLDILNETYRTFTERCDVNECITNNTCALLFDLSLLLITHKPHIMAQLEVRGKFVQVWRCYCGKTKDLFKNLLCVRNVMVFSQQHDETHVWIQYASFIAFLIKEELLSCDDFECQCTGFFKREWDEDSLGNLTLFLRTFIDCYKSNGGSVDKFVALLEFLSDFCRDL